MKEIIVVMAVGTALGIIRFVLAQRLERKDNWSGEALPGKVFDWLRPVIGAAEGFIMCAILLGNSDRRVSDALEYIVPSKHLDNLLEKLHEQTGI